MILKALNFILHNMSSAYAVSQHRAYDKPIAHYIIEGHDMGELGNLGIMAYLNIIAAVESVKI